MKNKVLLSRVGLLRITHSHRFGVFSLAEKESDWKERNGSDEARYVEGVR